MFQSTADEIRQERVAHGQYLDSQLHCSLSDKSETRQTHAVTRYYVVYNRVIVSV